MVEEYNKDYIPMREKFEELAKVLKNIKKGEKILIIGDNDGDGIPASAIFAKILVKLGLEYKKDFFTLFPEHDFRGLIKEDKEKQKELQQYKYIFLIDFSLDDCSFLSNSYICVLDHHKVDTKVNLVINPMYDDEMKTKQNCCSAALTYCLYRLMFGEDLILQKIAFVASMYDWFPIGSLPYLNISKEDTEYFVNGGYINPANYELVFITYQLYDDEFGTQFVFDRLFYDTDKDLKSIVILPRAFWDKLNAFNKRANKVLIKIFEEIEQVKDLNLVYLKEKDRPYKNALNIRIRSVYPGKSSFIFFQNKKEKGYNVSCRSQKYDLVKLIEFLKTQTSIQGGGHSVAAGFFVKKKELVLCKKLIVDNIEKFKVN